MSAPGRGSKRARPRVGVTGGPSWVSARLAPHLFGPHPDEITVVMTHRRFRASGITALAALSIVTLGACSSGGGSQDGGDAQTTLAASDLRIVSLSTRAHLVTGGDVLLRVEVGADLDASQVEVLANGDDVTPAFSRSGTAPRWSDSSRG